MSFCIPAGESPETALHRLISDRTRRARSRLADTLDDPAIHQARRELKRVRALLDLLGDGVRRKDLRRWRRELGRCSSELADARDACAMIQSLSLIPAPADIPVRSWKGLARRLQEVWAVRIRGINGGGRSRRLRRRLRGLQKDFRFLGPSIPGWKGLGRAIRDSYRRGRAALRRLEADPSPRNRHRWRVRVKRLSDQLSLIAPAESLSLAAWASGLEGLAERLGQEHDLFLLRGFVQGLGQRSMPQEHRYRILRAIRDRRREIAAAALGRGRRLFQLPSSGFGAAVRRQCRAREIRSAAALHDLASDSWSGRIPPATASPGDLLPIDSGADPGGGRGAAGRSSSIADGLSHPRSRGARRRRR
jgi:CHAD domain-containing protein